MVRAMSMSSSTPMMSSTPSSGRSKLTKVPARMTCEARGMPAMPLLVSIKVRSITSCWEIVRWTPAAWATKTEATAR